MSKRAEVEARLGALTSTIVINDRSWIVCGIKRCKNIKSSRCKSDPIRTTRNKDRFFDQSEYV